jgi:protein O-GlcNAc transferase
MDEHLAAADAALKAGDKAGAVGRLIAAIEADPARNAQVYRALCLQLFQLGRNLEGAEWSARAVARFPKEMEFWNLQAIFLRRTQRPKEALAAAEQAVRLAPKDMTPQVNRANILYDVGDYPRAEVEWAKLVRREPKNPEYHRQLARALMKQGKDDAALARFRQAVLFGRNNLNTWMDLAGFHNDFGRIDEAIATLDKAIAIFPDSKELLAGKAVVLRKNGRFRDAEAYLLELLPGRENAAWLHYSLGVTVGDYDRERGNLYFRKAVELDPTLEHLVALVESLNRTRTGDEGQNIEEAYQLAVRALDRGEKLEGADTKVLGEIFWRVADYARTGRVGDFAELGREWAKSGRHTALMAQLGRVRGPDDVRELVAQHRLWGAEVERRAAANPIHPPGPRPAGGKMRLGFMSSDLRMHPVGYFAMPLIEHLDRDRFELYCYSYYQGQADGAQEKIAASVDGFRWWPDISHRDAAQAIAGDQLDMLIELGGSTHMNKIEVMAWRPAGLQASWLGYPHSAGLESIDYLVVDPYILPKDPSLLIEKPMVLPHCWYSTSRMAFRAEPKESAVPPLRQNGYVTFGTANNPSKYSAQVLASWARIVKRTPNSRFLFIRPESSSPSFRANITAAFAREGVEPERVLFHAVRGRHLPLYNAIDLSLDTFPQTGGTTTCESLWMGAPVVSLVGEALYQRLSYSVLTNLGLGDLCATNVAAYEDTAVALANDPDRLAELRATMRARIGDSPLGRIEQWSRNFYDTVAKTIAAS